MDGFTAICLFREWEKLARSGDCQRQHICAISANSDELTKAKAFDSGFDNFLSKPTNIKVIIREIEKLHGEKKSQILFIVIFENQGFLLYIVLCSLDQNTLYVAVNIF